MSCKAENIEYLALYRKKGCNPSSVIECSVTIIQRLYDDAPFVNLDLLPPGKSRDEHPYRKRKMDTNTN